jgi:DNA-binding NarL/FixJ family response regulator
LVLRILKTRVLIVEDHKTGRQWLHVSLENSTEIDIVGRAVDAETALKKAQLLRPDLVLVDLTVPGSGLECTKRLKSKFERVKVLIVSAHDGEKYLLEMVDAGADGFILNNASADELIFAIKKIRSGGTYVGHEFTMNMLSRFKASNNGSARSDLKLTEREMDVLKLVAEGLTNHEMAQQLFTSVRTIETRRKKLLEKTNTTNTATLIKFAVQNGLIK